VKWASVGVFWVYGALSLFVLGHYVYASPSDLTLAINTLIIGEAVAASLLVIVAPLLIRQS
jgi:VCBS repeat-containing protein